MTRDEIIREYNVSPGKFEAEPLWVPELDEWLGRKRKVYLAEDDNGFVHAF